jgi:type I restriction enzyme M protein
LELGETVAVIGAPEGWADTVTVGRLSNIHQSLGDYAPGPSWNDVMFIDASNDYEKVKTQNQLRAEDIDKILSTYRTRKAEDKYAYIATLDEIKENDYNLNIPRYVDTFEEEEPVDLNAVSQELKNLAKEMERVDTTIADYCKQMGIETPF